MADARQADLERLAGLRGLLGDGIGAALYDLAARVPADQAIVEIGSFRGKSTAHLAAGARAGSGARVTAVDPWDLPGNIYGKHAFTDVEVRESFERQLRTVGLWDQITPIRAFSTNAAAVWPGPPIGLLFVDGDHTENAVRADVEAWTPHLADPHVIAFDDYDTRPNPGVKIVVDNLADSEHYVLRFPAEHLAVLESR